MPEKELAQPQVEPTQEAKLHGAEEPPQVAALVAELTSGAETEPKAKAPPSERTYTQAEWVTREAAKDKEIAQHRQAFAQFAMQREIERVQLFEAQSQAADRKAVDDGEITQEQAQARVQQRQQDWERRVAQQQSEARLHQVKAEVDDGLRILVAKEMAAQYGIEAKDLLGDKSLFGPDLMEAKAARLALEKAKAELKAAQVGAETFDSGQMGSVGASIDKMSPEQKIMHGLKYPQRKAK